jgi:hypothetical protein
MGPQAPRSGASGTPAVDLNPRHAALEAQAIPEQPVRGPGLVRGQLDPGGIVGMAADREAQHLRVRSVEAVMRTVPGL